MRRALLLTTSLIGAMAPALAQANAKVSAFHFGAAAKAGHFRVTEENRGGAVDKDAVQKNKDALKKGAVRSEEEINKAAEATKKLQRLDDTKLGIYDNALTDATNASYNYTLSSNGTQIMDSTSSAPIPTATLKTIADNTLKALQKIASDLKIFGNFERVDTIIESQNNFVEDAFSKALLSDGTMTTDTVLPFTQNDLNQGVDLSVARAKRTMEVAFGKKEDGAEVTDPTTTQALAALEAEQSKVLDTELLNKPNDVRYSGMLVGPEISAGYYHNLGEFAMSGRVFGDMLFGDIERTKGDENKLFWGVGVDFTLSYLLNDNATIGIVGGVRFGEFKAKKMKGASTKDKDADYAKEVLISPYVGVSTNLWVNANMAVNLMLQYFIPVEKTLDKAEFNDTRFLKKGTKINLDGFAASVGVTYFLG